MARGGGARAAASALVAEAPRIDLAWHGAREGTRRERGTLARAPPTPAPAPQASSLAASSPDAAGAALVRATVRGQAAAVRALLAAGAPADAAEPGTKRTALHWAAFAGADDLVSALLAAGADAGAQDVTGASPADWGDDRGHAALAARLRAAAGPPSLLARLTSTAAIGSLLALAAGAVFAAQRAGPQRRVKVARR